VKNAFKSRKADEKYRLLLVSPAKPKWSTWWRA